MPQAGATGGRMADGDDLNRPISLFYSYSHRDEDLRDRLHDHLAVLRWNGTITDWHDRKIPPGAEWEDAIDRHLTSSDIVLLLVSASFIASPYCWGKEMKKALERHDRGEARVIPIVLKPCRFQSTPFAKLQALPKDARPVTAWADQDTAFDDVVAGIERVVEELRSRRAATAKAEEIAAVEPQPAVKTTAPAVKMARGEVVVHIGVDPRNLPDLAVFKDVHAPWCPEMVVIPAGTFLMGSPDDEKERQDDEGPQHEVTIGYRFALGRYAVTVGEYRRFVEATGHRHEGSVRVWTGSKWEHDAGKSWGDPGFAQTDRHPVVGVNWRDAQAYVGWLSEATRQTYRLPSEAEWEYACRAGTTTPFSFGATISTDQANYDGNYTYGNGRKGAYRQRTVPVGSLPATPWGLYEMHGNVWEWVEDVWHDSYQDAPSDGSAWAKGGDQSRRVLRGGSWLVIPWNLRSARRFRFGPVSRNGIIGFRVARTLFSPES